MPRAEEATRGAGALVALFAASALVLVLFPAPAAVDRGCVDLVLALFAALLLGCAAVLLSPARRAVARRAAEAAGGPRWVGFAGVVFYAAYMLGDAWKEPAPPASSSVSTDKVINGFLFFLVFVAGVWTVNMSVLTGRGSRPAPPEAAEGELHGGEVEVDAMLP